MIRVALDGAAVGTGPDAALPPVTAAYRSGAVTLLATEGGNRPTVLSLVASGRMKLTAGSVRGERLDAEGTPIPLTAARLRRAVALIDTPLVAEHSDDVSIRTVVREEVALAARPTKGRGRGLPRSQKPERRPFGSLAAEERLRLLIDLATRRPDVEALVVTSPERHGGDPAAWFRVVREVAAVGVGVLVVTDHATIAHLERLPQAAPLGADALPLFSL